MFCRQKSNGCNSTQHASGVINNKPQRIVWRLVCKHCMPHRCGLVVSGWNSKLVAREDTILHQSKASSFCWRNSQHVLANGKVPAAAAAPEAATHGAVPHVALHSSA